MNNKDSERILREYFAGRLSPRLEEKVRAWLADSLRTPGKDQAFEKFFDERVQYRNANKQTYQNLAQLHKRLDFPRRHKARLPLGKRTGFRVAAVLIPVFILAGLTLLLPDRTPETPAMAMVTVITAADQQKQITLPDGSSVWLNSSSRMSYPQDFNGNRKVQLSGEGYFRVTKAGGAEFSVEAGGLTATVRGTEFNVKAREGGENTEVLLTEGRLEVRAGRRTVEMKPNDLLTMEADRKLTIDEVEPHRADWRKPLEITNMTLGEAMREIASHYHMELETEGTLPADDSINATFDAETGLATAMEVLRSTLLNFTYEIDGNTIRIRQ